MARDCPGPDCSDAPARPAPLPDADPQPDATILAVRQMIEDDITLPHDPKPDPELAASAAATDGPQDRTSDDRAPRPRPDTRKTISVVGVVRRFLQRPDAPRWITAGVVLAVFLYNPWLVVWLVVLSMLLLAVIYFSLGPDRSQELVLAWYGRLRTRNPDKAERIRRRAAKASARLAAVLENLPETWTRGLYLPDFDNDTEALHKLKPDPLDRLAEEVRSQRRRAAAIPKP